jgi:hypothetical protein
MGDRTDETPGAATGAGAGADAGAEAGTDKGAGADAQPVGATVLSVRFVHHSLDHYLEQLAAMTGITGDEHG